MSRNLLEMQIMSPTGPVTVIKNPPARLIGDLLASSKFGNVRGLLVGRDVYYWDAYYANHDEMAEYLGVPYDINDRIVVYPETAHGVIQVLLPDDRDRIKNTGFGFQRIFRDDNFRFEDGILHGSLSGPEYAELIAA